MRLIQSQLPDEFNLYLMSDFHFGTLLWHEAGFQETIEAIASDEKARAIIGGDLIEAICSDDPRWQQDTQDIVTPSPILQARHVAKMLTPIRDKIVFILDGNHELKLHRFGMLVRDIICKELDVPYGTYTAKLNCLDKSGKSMFKVFYTHGARALNSAADDPIRRKSNMELALKRALMNKAGDCVLMAMGHAHKLLVASPLPTLYLVDDGKRTRQRYTTPGAGLYIHPDHRWYTCTGSFLRLYGPDGVSGYAERFGYDPVELGYIKATVGDRAIQNVEAVVI